MIPIELLVDYHIKSRWWIKKAADLVLETSLKTCVAELRIKKPQFRGLRIYRHLAFPGYPKTRLFPISR